MKTMFFVQVFAHPAHFFGRAGESMDKQTRRFTLFPREKEGFSGGDDHSGQLSAVSFQQIQVQNVFHLVREGLARVAGKLCKCAR